MYSFWSESLNNGDIILQNIVEYNSHTNTVYFITFLPYTVDVQNSRIHNRDVGDHKKRVICWTPSFIWY